MSLTDAQVSALARNATNCGYDKVLAQVTYPPAGKIPLPNGGEDVVAPGCDLYTPLWDYGAIRAFCCVVFHRHNWIRISAYLIQHNKLTHASTFVSRGHVSKFSEKVSEVNVFSACSLDRVTDRCPGPADPIEVYFSVRSFNPSACQQISLTSVCSGSVLTYKHLFTYRTLVHGPNALTSAFSRTIT